jgi:ABC-2 type transport system permease protein
VKSTYIITIGLVAVITVLAVHVVTRTTEAVRIDVTEDSLYSLTEGTREILQKMQDEGTEPIDITLYFSETTGKSLPSFIKQFIVYEDYLQALLREYERAAGGKLRVHTVDPKPDSDEAQEALDDGLDGKPINQHGDLFFFGLHFETQTGSTDVIDFLWPDRQEEVEYEISRRIFELLWPSTQRIGVLSSLEVMPSSDPYMAQLLAAQGRQAPQPWIAVRLLQERYEVRRIEPDIDHISPDEIDLLVVIHPRNLSTKTLWAIDEWVATGGNTLIFVDPYAINDQPPPNPQNPMAGMQYTPASNLNRLTEGWGVTRSDDRVAADLALATRRQVSRRGGVEPVIVDLSIDQEVRDQVIATDHPITRGLERLRLFMAGSLDIEPPEGVEVMPLITTTAEGSTLEMRAGFPGGSGRLVFMDVNNPARLRDAFSKGSEPVVLAALLRGVLPSAFPEGATFPSTTPERPPGLPPGVEMPPPDDAEMVTTEPVPEEARAEATVLVVADTDIIADQIAFQNSILGTIAVNDNHKLLLNAVDYLFGASELMSVRAKSSIRRPFVLFDEIEAAAEEQTLERERELREEIAAFEEEIRTKQGEISRRNAALFQKKLQDDVDELNARAREAERELREIRKTRRAALESEERRVRFSIMGLMPTLVLIMGVVLFVRRKKRQTATEGGQS